MTDTISTPAEDPSCCGTVTAKAEEQGCCGGPAEVDATACCRKDELAKAEGKSGCGCGHADAEKANR